MTDLYAEDEPGLTIDAPESGDDDNPPPHPEIKITKPPESVNKTSNESPKSMKKQTIQRSPEGQNGSLIHKAQLSPNSTPLRKTDLFMAVDDDGLEEGEIPNEPMVKNFLESVSQPAAKKRKLQPTMIDASTCVTEGDDPDELGNMKNNQYYKLNVLILSRSSTSAGHTYMFTTNIRGQVYHGVLTDGSPPIIHNNQIQKRAMAAEKEKGAEESDSTEKRDATPKPRGQKRSKGDDDKSPLKARNRHKSPHLHEVCVDQYVRCPHKQCGHRFLGMNDLNSHLMMNHVDGGVILTDTIATQTDLEQKCKVCEQREQKQREENSINELFGGIKTEKPIKKEVEEPAPKLEKEELTKEVTMLSPTLEAAMRDSRLPTMPSITPRTEMQVEPGTAASQPLAMMPQAIAMGAAGYPWTAGPFMPNFANPSLAAAAAANKPPIPMPTFPGISSVGVNGLSPIPSNSKSADLNRHKIHELKSEAGTSATSISSTPTNSILGRSITSGTSGMDMLLRPTVPRPLNTASPQLNLLQQQLMLRQLIPGDLNQFSYLNGPPGLFPPPK